MNVLTYECIDATLNIVCYCNRWILSFQRPWRDARLYGIAVLAIALCPSVCPSKVDVLLKPLNGSSWSLAYFDLSYTVFYGNSGIQKYGLPGGTATSPDFTTLPSGAFSPHGGLWKNFALQVDRRKVLTTVDRRPSLLITLSVQLCVYSAMGDWA